MRAKSHWKTIVVTSTVLFFSGCAFNRNSDPRSASDVFIDVTVALIEMFADDEFDDDYATQNRKAFEKRREWQCENLTESELRDLGINK